MTDQFWLKGDKKAQTTQLPFSFAQEMKFAFVFNLKWKKKKERTKLVNKAWINWMQSIEMYSSVFFGHPTQKTTRKHIISCTHFRLVSTPTLHFC